MGSECHLLGAVHVALSVTVVFSFSSSGASGDDFSLLVDEPAAFVPLPVRINAVRNWEGKEVNCRNGEKEVSK